MVKTCSFHTILCWIAVFGSKVIAQAEYSFVLRIFSRFMDLVQLLHPLLPEHLGILAIGYHVADAPQRASLVVDLLKRNFALNISTRDVQKVMDAVLQAKPELISVHRSSSSILQPRSLAFQALQALQCVPAQSGTCIVDGGRLLRWASYPTTCFTISAGMCPTLTSLFVVLRLPPKKCDLAVVSSRSF